MQNNFFNHITDLSKDTFLAVLGMVGIDQAPSVVTDLAPFVEVAESAGSSPDWLTPVLQGLIAVATVLLQFFRGRKK